MTSPQDLFVGIVAMTVGALLTLGAILNSGPLMTLAKARLLADSVGTTAARWIIGGIGLAVVAIGVLIATGWRM